MEEHAARALAFIVVWGGLFLVARLAFVLVAAYMPDGRLRRLLLRRITAQKPKR